MLNQAIWNVGRAGSCVICWWVGASGMEQSLFQGQLKFSLMSSEDATVACSKVVVVASSHRRNPGSIPWRSQILAAKQTPIPAIAIVSQQGKLINFDILNPLSKSNGGRGRMSNFIFWRGLGVCYLLAGGWQWHGAKSFLGPAEIQSNVFGGPNNRVQHIFIQILYVQPFLLLSPDWKYHHQQ